MAFNEQDLEESIREIENLEKEIQELEKLSGQVETELAQTPKGTAADQAAAEGLLDQMKSEAEAAGRRRREQYERDHASVSPTVSARPGVGRRGMLI
ncbi:MAG: hypothetical protein IJ228_06330 [Succinivibrio sp.]|nr:hypothetical protein [Succinivibrio sp.]